MHLLHSDFGGFPSGGVGGDLGRKRGPLFGSLESAAASRRPHDHLALLIGDGDNRIIERRLNIGTRDRDVFPKLFLSTGARRSGLSGGGCTGRLGGATFGCWDSLGRLRGWKFFFCQKFSLFTRRCGGGFRAGGGRLFRSRGTDGLSTATTRSRVGFGALTPAGQITPMTESAVRSDIHQATDIRLDIAPKIALHPDFTGLNDRADLIDFRFG
jgi:hypothetical protein